MRRTVAVAQAADARAVAFKACLRVIIIEVLSCHGYLEKWPARSPPGPSSPFAPLRPQRKLGAPIAQAHHAAKGVKHGRLGWLVEGLGRAGGESVERARKDLHWLSLAGRLRLPARHAPVDNQLEIRHLRAFVTVRGWRGAGVGWSIARKTRKPPSPHVGIAPAAQRVPGRKVFRFLCSRTLPNPSADGGRADSPLAFRV